MASRKFILEPIGSVTITKRKSSKTIRISISGDGEVRVSIPFWTPYKIGLEYLKHKADWVNDNMPDRSLLTQGYSIGKAHHINFATSQGISVSSHIKGNQINIMLPVGEKWDSDISQKKALSGAIRALKKESQLLLPQRTEVLADKHGYTYSSVTIKKLKGRWGSCSIDKHIVLNCFLMKLPWELIDYVILHELAHTKHMSHNHLFWSELTSTLTNAKSLRGEIKKHHPTI